jgi:hypothetical protein
MSDPYTVNSYDVCVSGFERLRSQTEWMIAVPVDGSTTRDELREAMKADIQGYMQPDWFDFDKANAMIDAFCAELGELPFPDLETREEDEDCNFIDEEGCSLYVYIQAPEIVPVYQF